MAQVLGSLPLSLGLLNSGSALAALGLWGVNEQISSHSPLVSLSAYQIKKKKIYYINYLSHVCVHINSIYE